MPRKRQIDPGFWTSEQVVGLSIPARLMFVGMISTADDEGRLKGAALCLKLTVFPGDAVELQQVAEWRDEVVAGGLANRYQVEGTELLWMPNWHKHQHVNRAYPSKLPPHPDDKGPQKGGDKPRGKGDGIKPL